MDWLSFSLVGLLAFVILTTFILYQTGAEKNVPYFSWFELHYTVAINGILAILLLAHLNVLDKGTIATTFSSLIAYVLGASTGKSRAGTSETTGTGTPDAGAGPSGAPLISQSTTSLSTTGTADRNQADPTRIPV